jgi:hypothetical protein
MDEVEDTQSRLSMLLISLLTSDHSKKIDAALDEDSEDEYETRRKSTIRAQSPVSVGRKGGRSPTDQARPPLQSRTT